MVCVMTGNCIHKDKDIFTCEIRGWCPVEVNKLHSNAPMLPGTENFTVLIKNSIQFNRWPHIKTRNILANWTLSYLKNCRYHPIDNKLCPIFRFGTIINAAGVNYTELAFKGGVVGIFINWDCDLDYNINHCVPAYSFHRLDSANGHVAPGWNFRYAQRYSENLRTLFKAYGILFVVMVEGRGRKFNIIPLLLNVGSGLALLSVAKIVSDFIVLRVMRKRDFYRKKKYLKIYEEDDDTPCKRLPIIYHQPHIQQFNMKQMV
uniref:Uncharacterized protein n=1 Tax=Strigamia maritima TaxID=126957 RepID=T1IMJ9_STRMM